MAAAGIHGGQSYYDGHCADAFDHSNHGHEPKILYNGFRSLFQRSPNMDALVAIGSLAAFGYSTWAVLAMTQAQLVGDMDAVMGYMHAFYFETAATTLP